MQLGTGPNENRQRPAVNVLFRSAALSYGPRVIGVLDDGSSGLWDIKQRGGRTVVQEPSSARFSDMPWNALENVPIDDVVTLDELAPLLTTLAGQPVPIPDSKTEHMIESHPTALTCPEHRGGAISEFRCRVGHRYSPESFLSTHADTRERALWAAVVALGGRRRGRCRGSGSVPSLDTTTPIGA